jgi:hypothetical protein
MLPSRNKIERNVCLEKYDGMLDGKLNIIIFSILPKTGSVGPVEQQINLVSPKIHKL